MKIGKTKIGDGEAPYVIAEIGINHDGDFDTCISLLHSAKACGVNAAKLQVFRAEKFLSKSSSYFDIFSALSFSEEQYIEIFEEAKKIGLVTFASVFDFDSLDMLDRLKVPAYKIASGDITHLPLLREIGRRNKPVILSTGASTIEECWTALEALNAGKINTDVALLHCVSHYPLKYSEANLSVINSMKDEFLCPVGFSDHSIGSDLPISAVALGANIIEKHFTLDTKRDGLDHAGSADPKMMKQIVASVKNVWLSRGSAIKFPVEDQIHIKNIRRSITARQTIPKGTVIDMNMLEFRRPEIGFSPNEIEKVVGKTASKQVLKGTAIQRDDLE